MIWSRIYRVKIKFTDPPWNCRQKLKVYLRIHQENITLYGQHDTILYFQIWSSLSMIEGYHIQIRDMSIDNSEKVNGFDVVTIAGGATR